MLYADFGLSDEGGRGIRGLAIRDSQLAKTLDKITVRQNKYRGRKVAKVQIPKPAMFRRFLSCGLVH